MTEQQNTENEVIVTIKSINYSGKWMEFWFEENFREDELLPQSYQFSCKQYMFWELVDRIQGLRQHIDINGVKGLKIKLEYTSPNWHIIEIIQNKPMNEQQKLLQKILSEAGINLTDNQILAIIDAVSLSCKSPVPYHEVMEFKEKYASCVSNNDLTIVDLHSIVSNASANLFEIKKDVKSNHESLASHYNENNQPER